MKRTDKTDIEQFYGQGFRDRVNKANDDAAKLVMSGKPLPRGGIAELMGITSTDLARLLNALDEGGEGFVTLPINNIAAISVEVPPMPTGAAPLPIDVDRFYAPQEAA